MDSNDDDGNYGYDIPDDDDAGPGFRIGGTTKSSHLLVASDNSSDEDGCPSSDEEGDGDGDDNFAYGAFAARKRRKRERKSKHTDRERNLYGVFYDDDSSDEERGRGRRARRFDKQSNRLAGLAFVRGSSVGDDEGAAETKSERVGKTVAENVPGWLKDEPREKSSAKSDSSATVKRDGDIDGEDAAVDDDDDEMDMSEDDDDGANDEEEAERLARDRERRFEELLAVANTSKNPLTHVNSVGKRGQRPIEATHDNDDRGGIGSDSRGIGFGNDINYGIKRDEGEECSDAQPPVAAGIGFTSRRNDGDAQNTRSTLEPSSSNVGGLGLGASTQGDGIGGHRPSGLGLGMMASQNDGLGHPSPRTMAAHHRKSERETEANTSQNRGGLGMGGSSYSGTGMGWESYNNFPSFSQGGIGLGLGAASQHSAKKRKDPNLGKWEKHTKGIGMKLLQKMGYEGSGGLGAKRRHAATKSSKGDDTGGKVPREETAPAATKEKEVQTKKGISRPVEVVVRPNGLGLGYGNFKEQSQLKVNRQIEAEVRGIRLDKEGDPKKNVEEAKSKGFFEGIDKSILPSTDSLLAEGADSWRRGGKRGGKKTRRKIVHYQDILKQTAAESEGPRGAKIIDMRGASAIAKDHDDRQPSDAATPQAAVQIGEELLHNVTLLLNTHEGQLRTASYMVKSTEGRIAALEKEREDMEERRRTIEGRGEKMKLALDVVERADRLIDKLSFAEEDPKTRDNDEILEFAMDSLTPILATLYSDFSREERRSLKFDAALMPSITKPVFDLVTSQVNLLNINATAWLDHLASGIRKLCDAAGSDDEAYALRELIFVQSIIPWVQGLLGSPRWDPVGDAETGLRVYESLLNCACNSFSSAEQEENDILKETITEEIVRRAVLPKLLRAVDRWRPKLLADGGDTGSRKRREKVADLLHLWILPWLPHVGDDPVLGTFLDDVRRNLKKTLSFLGKSLPDDVTFVRSCISTLFPWRTLLEDATIFELTSTAVSPRFARSLARVEINIAPDQQDWSRLHVLYDYFEKSLMCNNDFVSLIEGEVLPAWAHALHGTLQSNDRSMDEIKIFYIIWKEKFFYNDSCPSVQLILRSDSMVCKYLYGGLKMIQSALESKQTFLDGPRPPLPEDCNYRVALMRRSKERTAQNGVGCPAGAENVRLRRKAVPASKGNEKSVSFREVVEAFANAHGITFLPKLGSNSAKDGKPVFLFGNHPIYLDKNVLFALRGSNWQPISLEHLAQAC